MRHATAADQGHHATFAAIAAAPDQWPAAAMVRRAIDRCGEHGRGTVQLTPSATRIAATAAPRGRASCRAMSA